LKASKKQSDPPWRERREEKEGIIKGRRGSSGEVGSKYRKGKNHQKKSEH